MPVYIILLPIQILIKHSPVQTHQMRTSQAFIQPSQTAFDQNITQTNFLQTNRPISYESNLMASRISQRMRSLSPGQARTVRPSTLLQPGQQLVPTDNLWRVRGKKFTPVQVEVREGPPIPAGMLRMPSLINGQQGPVPRETVYEIRNKISYQKSLSQNHSVANLRTVFPVRPQLQQQAQPTFTIAPTRTSIVAPAQARRVASPVRVSARPSLPFLNPVIEPISTINRYNTLGTRNMQDLQQEKEHRTQVAHEYYGGTTQEEPKSKYKYNFFSALDEAVNSKCGSCGANEFIASKPLSSWE